MKKGEKVKIIPHPFITQGYIAEGCVCEYVTSFDNYACVKFRGTEWLVRKELIKPVP